MSLAEARQSRENPRALVKQGIHPAHERQRVKQSNLAALEDRKPAHESSFAKVAIKQFSAVMIATRPYPAGGMPN